jgi:hypothetical protein
VTQAGEVRRRLQRSAPALQRVRQGTGAEGKTGCCGFECARGRRPEKAKATDAEQAKKIIPDRVHPGASGHLLMAAELLKSWQAPALVSGVEIDAKAKK